MKVYLIIKIVIMIVSMFSLVAVGLGARILIEMKLRA